jgi:hypothetical protein
MVVTLPRRVKNICDTSDLSLYGISAIAKGHTDCGDDAGGFDDDDASGQTPSEQLVRQNCLFQSYTCILLTIVLQGC